MEERAIGREKAHYGVVFDCVMCCAMRDFTGDERGMMQGAKCTLTKMTVLRKISLQRIRGGQRSTESWKNYRRIKRRCRSRRCTRGSLREISPVYWICYSSRTNPRNKQLMRLLCSQSIESNKVNSTPRTRHHQLLILLTVIS